MTETVDKLPDMHEYKIEVRGTITRDIRWVRAVAANEDEARQEVERELPSYRIASIALVGPGSCDGTTPADADG